MVYLPKKVSGQPNSLEKWVECSCDSLDMEQLNNEAPSQILVPEFRNHNGLPTLHLEYASWSHISNHIYARNYLKLDNHPMLNLDHQYIFHFCQNKHHQCSCKVCIWVATIDWSQHPRSHELPTQQNMTTSHFDISFRIQVSPNCMAHMSMGKHPCWIDVYSYLDCKWIGYVGLI
jgi:hypothetical protein